MMPERFMGNDTDVSCWYLLHHSVGSINHVFCCMSTCDCRSLGRRPSTSVRFHWDFPGERCWDWSPWGQQLTPAIVCVFGLITVSCFILQGSSSCVTCPWSPVLTPVSPLSLAQFVCFVPWVCSLCFIWVPMVYSVCTSSWRLLFPFIFLLSVFFPHH